jgi:hypothetical protein
VGCEDKAIMRGDTVLQVVLERLDQRRPVRYSSELNCSFALRMRNLGIVETRLYAGPRIGLMEIDKPA